MPVPSPYADRLSRLPVERREVEVRGATTAYWVYGDADSETTVIAVHALQAKLPEEAGDAAPLVYHNRQYHALGEHSRYDG